MDRAKETRVIRLTSRLLDNCISEEEKTELQDLLSTDDAARAVYVKLLTHESKLCSSMGELSSSREGKVVRGRFRMASVVSVAAASLIGFSFAWGWMIFNDFSNAESVAFLRTSSDAPAKLIKTGKYKVRKGDYHLDFFSGAKIKVSAPAEFEILDSMHMHVKSGKLVANINPSARLFKITGKNNSFVDLGTEFALNVDQSDKNELYVYKGEVVANTINENGYTERVENVTTNQALSYDPVVQRFDVLANPEDRFLQSKEHRSIPLKDVTSYQQQIHLSKPLYYWSFDNPDDSFFSSWNQMGVFEQRGAHIEQSLNGSNGAVCFTDDDSFHQMRLNEPITFEDNTPFSVEFLFCPDRVSRASLFSLFDESSVDQYGSADHFVLIETLASPEWYSHLPVCVRTVYRPVAGKNSQYGINAFTETHYFPGKWVHLVVSFDGQVFRTYMNAQLQNEVHLGADELSSTSQYAMVIGQMASFPSLTPPERNFRPFIGLMDELSIYKRELNADEVKQHFRALDLD